MTTNRANSLHSTGPRTAEGKQRAAMNALKHGLTGQRLILQPQEHEAYRELTESLHAELQPKTTMELQVVQKIIDTHMRLNRAATIDNNMLNFGLLENCIDVKDGGSEDDEIEIAHAQARSWMAQEISFEKLGRYEGRLSRQLIAYSKELERLQSVRAEKEKSRRLERIIRRSHGRRSRGGDAVAGQVLARHGAGQAAAASVAQFAQPIEITTGKASLPGENGRDLSPHNSGAGPNPWSAASFGSEPEAGLKITAPRPAAPTNDVPEQAA